MYNSFYGGGASPGSNNFADYYAGKAPGATPARKPKSPLDMFNAFGGFGGFGASNGSSNTAGTGMGQPPAPYMPQQQQYPSLISSTPGGNVWPNLIGGMGGQRPGGNGGMFGGLMGMLGGMGGMNGMKQLMQQQPLAPNPGMSFEQWKQQNGGYAPNAYAQYLQFLSKNPNSQQVNRVGF